MDGWMDECGRPSERTDESVAKWCTQMIYCCSNVAALRSFVADGLVSVCAMDNL